MVYAENLGGKKINIKGPAKKTGATLGEGSFLRADWLCIGCPKIVDSRNERNSNGIFLQEPLDDNYQVRFGRMVYSCLKASRHKSTHE